MTHTLANGLLLLAALFWGIGNVPQKLVLDDLGPFTAVGLRCLIAAVVIVPFIWRDLVRPAGLSRGDRIRLLEVSMLFAGAIGMQQFAFGSTTVTNAGFLISTTTVMTPLVVWWLLRERPTTAVWVAIAAALSGALLMSGGAVQPFAPGDFACLVSAGLYSFWFVRLGALVARTGRPGMVTLAQFTLAGLSCLCISFGVETITVPKLEAASTNLLLLGTIGTGLPFGLQALAQQYATPSTAAILTSAESVFGAAAAAIFLGEWFTPGMGLGALLLMAAVVAVHMAPPPARPLPMRADQAA